MIQPARVFADEGLGTPLPAVLQHPGRPAAGPLPHLEVDIEPRVTAPERDQMQKILELIATDKMDEAAKQLEKNRGDYVRGFVNYTYLSRKGGRFGYGTIHFSDSSTVAFDVRGYTNTSPLTIDFTRRTGITWMKVVSDGGGGTCSPGLAEVEAYDTTPLPVSLVCIQNDTPNASVEGRFKAPDEISVKAVPSLEPSST